MMQARKLVHERVARQPEQPEGALAVLIRPWSTQSQMNPPCRWGCLSYISQYSCTNMHARLSTHTHTHAYTKPDLQISAPARLDTRGLTPPSSNILWRSAVDAKTNECAVMAPVDKQLQSCQSIDAIGPVAMQEALQMVLRGMSHSCGGSQFVGNMPSGH